MEGTIYIYSSSIFPCCPSVPPSHLGDISTICFRPYKPYIFWKLMTPIIQWLSAHSTITHTDLTIPTKLTHNPPHMTISPHDTNQICSCRLLFSIPMTTSKSWHSEFRTVVQGLVWLFVCFLPYNIGHFFFNSGIPTPNAPASRPWQYRPIGASGSQHQPIGARRVSRPPALPGINGHSQIPTDGSTLMRILWMRSGLNGKNGKRIVHYHWWF